jgi:enolase-phosphatase E1
LAARAILTDIEGTTTPIAFVKETLFPFARARMHAFVRAHVGEPAIQAALGEVAQASGHSPDEVDALCNILLQWIDEDRKATALKLLQGLIWDAGYQDGVLRAPIYDDAARQLRDWHARGVRLYVYSSGSVHAQKLLFRHSDKGNLLPLFSGYFDTTSGNKREVASYAHIADAIGLPPGDILFLSDVPEELDAAHGAGMRTTWLVRPNDVQIEPSALAASAHPWVHEFGAISL